MEKSWLVGDFKLSTKKVKNYVDKPENQWLAMSKYAEDRQFIPLTMFITFYSPTNQADIKNIQKKALDDYNSLLTIIPLTTLEQ